MKRLLEICCDHLGSALAAQAGGADRIELCAALCTDGLTPSAGLLTSVKKHLSIPVFVLIRPRPGNFVYTDMELASMLFDIHQCKALGADGIVSGALKHNGAIDAALTARLIAASRPLPFTFHKAFDLTPEPLEALDLLMDLAVDRVLTSGPANSAVEGKAGLTRLAQMSKGKLIILCGGGIRDYNLASLTDVSGLNEFHSAALNKNSTQKEKRASILRSVDQEMVKRMAEILL